MLQCRRRHRRIRVIWTPQTCIALSSVWRNGAVCRRTWLGPRIDSTRIDRSESEVQQTQPAATSGRVRDTGHAEPTPADDTPGEVNGARTLEDEPQKQGLGRVFDYVTGWARTANAERQRRDVIGGMGSVKEATSVSIESGKMMILSTRILDVVDYRVVPLSPQLYAGGSLSTRGTISRHLRLHWPTWKALTGGCMRRFQVTSLL